MYQTLILAGIIAINVYNGINTMMKFNGKQLLMVFLSMAIFGPIVEEILFRYALSNFLIDYTYKYEINAILFGLIHAQNFFVIQNVYLVLFQICATTYLGYYIVQLDSLFYACIVHILYNFFGLGLSQAYIHYYDIKLVNSFNNPNEKFIRLNHVDDYLNTKSKMDFKIVKLRPDIQESFDLYDSKKRPSKNNININFDEILTKNSQKSY